MAQVGNILGMERLLATVVRKSYAEWNADDAMLLTNSGRKGNKKFQGASWVAVHQMYTSHSTIFDIPMPPVREDQRH